MNTANSDSADSANSANSANAANSAPEANQHSPHPVPRGGRSRRRFWIAGALAGTLSLATLGACSHQRSGGWHDNDGDPSARIERMVDKVFSRVDASDDQKAKISEIAKSAYQDLSPLRGELKAGRSKAVELLTADSIDRAAVESLRSGQIGQLDKASERATRAMADIAEVLTPAQRAQVREKLTEHMNKRRGWGRWGHRS
ncbi:MAG: Spy/CpxP family protein refolding chaperone [Burkholderiaceae bacterium]